MKRAEQWALGQAEKSIEIIGTIAAFLKGNVDETDFRNGEEFIRGG